jgi:hypothetical protein
MEIVLNNKDLQQLDKLIQDMPFKYGYPLFLILTKKIEETKLAQTIKVLHTRFVHLQSKMNCMHKVVQNCLMLKETA